VYYVTAGGVVESVHRDVTKAIGSRRKLQQRLPQYSHAIARLDGRWTPSCNPAPRYWRNSMCVDCGTELSRGIEPTDGAQRCKACWNVWMDRGAKANA
jgi:hypothetical protein